jgi:hypothetical protein
MMHDFICGECSLSPLTSVDVVCARAFAYEGDTSLLLNAADFDNTAVTVDCKRQPSLLDDVYGYGAHMNCCGEGGGSNVEVIDVNSCIVSCGRCGSCIGDGLIQDNNGVVEVGADDNTLFISDISRVRLLLHTIVLESAVLQVDTEQVFYCSYY